VCSFAETTTPCPATSAVTYSPPIACFSQALEAALASGFVIECAVR
jgi:hypothetical protein